MSQLPRRRFIERSILVFGCASTVTCEPPRNPANPAAAPGPIALAPSPSPSPTAARPPEETRSPTETPGVLVGSLQQLEPGSARTVSYQGLPILVINDGGELRAVSGICTHENCAVEWRVELGIIQCPCHDGRFNTRGKVLSGPPPAPLLEFGVVVEEEQVYIVNG